MDDYSSCGTKSSLRSVFLQFRPDLHGSLAPHRAREHEGRALLSPSFRERASLLRRWATRPIRRSRSALWQRRAQYDKVAEATCEAWPSRRRDDWSQAASPLPMPAGGYYIRACSLLRRRQQDAHRAARRSLGPCSASFTYKTLDEAIAIANDTPYGLNGPRCTGPRKAEAIEVAARHQGRQRLRQRRARAT